MKENEYSASALPGTGIEEGASEEASAAKRRAARRKRGVFAGSCVLAVLFLLWISSFSGLPAAAHRVGSGPPAADQQVDGAVTAVQDTESGPREPVAAASPSPSADDEIHIRTEEAPEVSGSPAPRLTDRVRFSLSRTRSNTQNTAQQESDPDTKAKRNTVTRTKKVRVGESLGRVVTSGYCSCPICCGQWAGGTTASGTYPIPNHTIAVDAEEPFVPIGTHVIMNGVEYVVEDTGDFARYGVQFDVYYESHAEALRHGHRTWEVFLADAGGKDEIRVIVTEAVG